MLRNMEGFHRDCHKCIRAFHKEFIKVYRFCVVHIEQACINYAGIMSVLDIGKIPAYFSYNKHKVKKADPAV